MAPLPRFMFTASRTARRACLTGSARRGVKSFDSVWGSHLSEGQTVTIAEGIDLHVRTGGVEGGLPVLCMPGALGTAQTDFGPQLSGGLGEDFTVVSFDPRGYGLSRPPARDFPIDFYHRDAIDGLAIMTSLGFDRFSVLGWSDGCNSACIMAATEPDRVENLVVWGGNSYITKEDLELWEQVRDISNWSERMRSSMGAVYGMDELQAMNNRFTDAMLELMDKKDGNIFLDLVHRIQCPTLVLHGELDQMVSSVHPRYLAKQIADARLHVIAEGKHNIHIRFKDEFNKLVASFLLEGKEGVRAGAVEEVEELEGEEGVAAPAKKEEPYVNINDIAYGFMGSKALFAALHADVFDICAGAGDSGCVKRYHSSHLPAAMSYQVSAVTLRIDLLLAFRCVAMYCDMVVEVRRWKRLRPPAQRVEHGYRHYLLPVSPLACSSVIRRLGGTQTQSPHQLSL